MKKLPILLVVVWVALVGRFMVTSADGPELETIDLTAVMHVASLPPPSGSGSGGIASLQMSAFQSGGGGRSPSRM